MKNIFIEGIQGAGKSTLVNRLAQRLPEYSVYREGDLSPVELAWCSYMSVEQYHEAIEKFGSFEKEIRNYTMPEGDKRIIAYTRILTDMPEFYRYMESYEIYNGRVSFEAFKKIIFLPGFILYSSRQGASSHLSGFYGYQRRYPSDKEGTLRTGWR